jgi:hypothetical protein
MNSNPELEKKIIGAMLLEEEPRTKALNSLREYDFECPDNVKIFNAIKQLVREQKGVDIVIVSGLIDVDDVYLLDCQNSIATTANIDEYICQLRNLTLQRKFMSGASELIEQMPTSINPGYDMIQFASKLNKLAQFSLDSLQINRRTAGDDIRELKDEPPEKRYSFGIKFLDDALNGYHGKDVIVISTRTGRGKTELCNIVAVKAAMAGNKVLYLALEAEKKEIGARLKFRVLCRLYFEDNPTLIYPLSFDKWMAGKLDILDKYEDQASEILSKYAHNICVQYRNTEFTVDDLNQQLNSCQDIDVIILDHIHYVDILDSNENKGLKIIAKCIRQNNLLYQKPIILAAHVRKTNKREDGLTPDDDDIYGSSDLSKIVTKTILFSPDLTELHDYLYRTFFWISKNRRNSSPLRYIIKSYFDSRFNLYQDKYKLGKYIPFGKEFIECDKFPSWYPEYYRYNTQNYEQAKAYKD